MNMTAWIVVAIVLICITVPAHAMFQDAHGNTISPTAWLTYSSDGSGSQQSLLEVQPVNATPAQLLKLGLIVVADLPPPPPTPQQQATAAIAAGLTISSTSNPSLNALYAIDLNTQLQISSASLYIQEYSVFPDGQTTFPWPDLAGNVHTFQSTASFQAFARAVSDYLTGVNLTEQALAANKVATFPIAQASIP